MRSPSFRDASTYVVSFSKANACSGVLVRERLTWQISQLGASNVLVVAWGTVRFRYVYRLRRYRFGPCVGDVRTLARTARQFQPHARRLVRLDGGTAQL